MSLGRRLPPQGTEVPEAMRGTGLPPPGPLFPQPSRPTAARPGQGSGLGPRRPRAPPSRCGQLHRSGPGTAEPGLLRRRPVPQRRTQAPPPGPGRALQRGAALRRRAPASIPRHGSLRTSAGNGSGRPWPPGRPPARRGTTAPSTHLGPEAARGRLWLAAGLAGSQPTPHNSAVSRCARLRQP